MEPSIYDLFDTRLPLVVRGGRRHSEWTIFKAIGPVIKSTQYLISLKNVALCGSFACGIPMALNLCPNCICQLGSEIDWPCLLPGLHINVYFPKKNETRLRSNVNQAERHQEARANGNLSLCNFKDCVFCVIT